MLVARGLLFRGYFYTVKEIHSFKTYNPCNIQNKYFIHQLSKLQTKYRFSDVREGLFEILKSNTARYLH